MCSHSVYALAPPVTPYLQVVVCSAGANHLQAVHRPQQYHARKHDEEREHELHGKHLLLHAVCQRLLGGEEHQQGSKDKDREARSEPTRKATQAESPPQ